jgi:hypothetical protein
MSAGTRPRYFVEKPQKGGGVLHYWQPSKSLKASGYKTVPLSRVRAEAIQQADALNAKVDQWKGGLPILAKNTHGTLPWLIDAYKQSPKWAKLRDSTKNGYKHYCSRILKWSAERGHPPMRTFTRRDAEQLWGSLQHTPAHAAALVKVCKLLWNYADDLDEDIVARNPFRKLDLPGCEIPEIAAFGGWSIASVHQMLKVYCPLNLTMAQNGLVKLEQYRAKRPLEG